MAFQDWTTDELEAREGQLSTEIQTLDNEIARLREQMRALSAEADPFRVELQRRRREAADRDPRTQTIGDE